MTSDQILAVGALLLYVAILAVLVGVALCAIAADSDAALAQFDDDRDRPGDPR